MFVECGYCNPRRRQRRAGRTKSCGSAQENFGESEGLQWNKCDFFILFPFSAVSNRKAESISVILTDACYSTSYAKRFRQCDLQQAQEPLAKATWGMTGSLALALR